MLYAMVGCGLFTIAASGADTPTAPERTLVEWKGAATLGMKTLAAEAKLLDGGWLGLSAKAESGGAGIAVDAGALPWNLEGLAQVAVAIRNNGTAPVRVMLRVDDAKSEKKTDTVHFRGICAAKLAPGAAPVWLSVELGDRQFTRQYIHLRGNPPGLSAGAVNESAVTRVSIFVLESGKAERKIAIGPILARGVAPHLTDIDALMPFIDPYGQFKYKEWPDKIHQEGDFAQRLAMEKADLALHARPAGWDRFGGWLNGPQLKATGFFRVEKLDGVWWMIDPEGRRFWSHGVVRVGTRYRVGSVYHGTPILDRENYFQLPPRDGPLGQFYDTEVRASHGYYGDKEGHAVYDHLEANLFRKYGPDWPRAYSAQAQQRLASWGLNTIANSSDPQIFQMRRTPYTAIVYSVPLGRTDHTIVGSKQGWVKFPDPFDPGFRSAMDRTLQTTLKPVLHDPWCLGFFVDNEMHFGDAGSLAEAALASPPEQQAKIAFIEELKKKYTAIGKLNEAWGTRHADWDALLSATAAPDKKRPSVRADLEAFSERILDGYFRACRDAIAAASPGHMYLGCRFSGSNPLVLRVAGKYCDIMSFNAYRHDLVDYDPAPGVDRPIVIGEFNFNSLDRGKFNAAFNPVVDQTERAEAYCRYVTSALRNPKVVGTHWFQFYDEPTTGRFDGENFQFGLLDICDTPYWETIAACRELGSAIYTIRSKGQP